MHAIARPFATAGLALAASGLIAVAPMAPPPEHHILSAAVRLADTSSLLGDLGNLGGLVSDLGSLGNLGGLASLANIGGLADPGSLGGLFADGSLLNIPYNIFADIVNIPFYESLALQEYAYALGPAGAVGGVPGWIPPGATVANGGVEIVNGLPYYALGGTGSWYGESIGNTWGWDNGNWPQLDAISHFLLPFQFTEPWAEQVQTFAQAELIDGAHIGCEFECANPLGYLGGWLHGQTSLASLLSGFNFPTELTDTVGQNVGSIINVANPQVTVPTPVGDVTGTGAIWSGQPGQLDPLTFLTALGSNLTSSPANNPIQFPDIGAVFTNAVKLWEDTLGPNNNFNPFGVGSFQDFMGSFLYWGAAKDYSIPSALGGTLQDFTGIPNQWGLANLGAEPVSGYTSTPLNLPGNFLQGFEYFLNGDGGAAGNGLLGYLNPEIYLQALNTDIGILTNPNNLLASLPLVGFLGLGNNVPGAIAPGSFLGTFAPGFFSGPFDGLFSSFDLNGLLSSFEPTGLLSSFDLNGLLSSFDPTGLLSSFDPATLLSSFDPGSLLGALDPTALTTELGALLPNIGTDLAAMLGPELGSNLATTLGPELALNFANLIPQLAMSFLGL
jgi:hypothetical protein